MRFALVLATVAAMLPVMMVRAEIPASARQFAFRDVGEASGLFPHIAGIRGHAAGWGDADGDGWIDLYVATFHTAGSKANQFFRNQQGTFRLDEQQDVRISTRASAALFADLDNDNDLDLYIGSMPAPQESALAKREGRALLGCTLFRNDGDGNFTNISQDNGACPPAFGGRSATILDYDGDGLLDLLVGEDPLPGYNGRVRAARGCSATPVTFSFRTPRGWPGFPTGFPATGWPPVT